MSVGMSEVAEHESRRETSPDALERWFKAAIRRWPGRYPAYWARQRLLGMARVPAHRRHEDREVQGALAAWQTRPVAEVAVIIPTYRRPERLRDAVESALAQTFTDHVVIVIDDGGGLGDLPDDERLFSYSLARHSGIAGVVRNVGIRASASRTVAFLDDDNTWTDDHLEHSMAAHRAGVELSYTGLRRVDVAGRELDVLCQPFDRHAMREHTFVDTSTLVIRRRNDVRFPRNRIERDHFAIEDWALVYRLSRSMRTELVDEVTVRYLVHDGSYFTDWAAARARGKAPDISV